MKLSVAAVKANARIEEIVGQYVNLVKHNQELKKAACPFHQEDTPSFFVNTARQIFVCFGCGAKGDVIEFLKRIEGISFSDVIKILER